MTEQLAGHWHIFNPGTTDRTLILLHGTGGDEESMLEFGYMLDNNANILSVRGNVREQEMNRFFARLGEGVYDYKDLHQRTNLLAEFLRIASVHYSFDLKNAVLVGYSNGANMALSLQLAQPSLFRSSLLFRTLFPIDHLLNQPLQLHSTRIRMFQGNRDPLVSRDQTNQLVAFLRNHQADIEVHNLDQGHTISTKDIVLAEQELSIG